MEDSKIKYLPLDKSWYIRLCLLSLKENDNQVIDFLDKKKLSNDLKVAVNAVKYWNTGEYVHVGESATLLRFLKFYCWHNNIDKHFIMGPMLRKREICNDSDIVNWPIEKLIELDYGTSQWVSAAMLVRKDMNLYHPEGTNANKKINLTRAALHLWYHSGDRTKIVIDETIKNQASYFLGRITDFEITSAEDYCFARAFNLMTKSEGKKSWPQLVNHESNRLDEMEAQIDKTVVSSTDHRVVQALALKAKKNNRLNINILYPECVNKSWPEFWKFHAST
jgi:hypothetical protein